MNDAYEVIIVGSGPAGSTAANLLAAAADQAQPALRLFDTGGSGWCDACGQPNGMDRLMVFPRATMCVTCKQREERR